MHVVCANRGRSFDYVGLREENALFRIGVADLHEHTIELPGLNGHVAVVCEGSGDEVVLEDIKWVVLMVLFNQPGQEANVAWMEDMMFDSDQEYRH